LGFLRKYIFANAGLKLLALAISFLVWATYTAEPYAEVGFQVPLEFTTMPPLLRFPGMCLLWYISACAAARLCSAA